MADAPSNDLMDITAPGKNPDPSAGPGGDLAKSPPFIKQLGIDFTPSPAIDPASIISSLHDFTDAQTAQMKAQSEATVKNQSVMETHQMQQDQIDSDTLDALDKAKKIDSWGGGEGGGIPRILGFFDGDWNLDVQKNRITANTVKSEQLANRAKSMIEINNQTPAVAAAATAAKKDVFDANMKIVDLAQKATSLNLDAVKTELLAADEYVKVDANKRTQIDNALLRMDEGQAKAQLALAQQGKGDWVGYTGMLTKRIRDEEEAKIHLGDMRRAQESGDIDLFHKKAEDFATKIPTSVLGPLIEQAQKDNNPFVVIGEGKNQVKLPIMDALSGMKKTGDLETAVRSTMLASDNNRVANSYNDVLRTATALAPLDASMSAEIGFLANMRQRTDMTNPTSVQNFGAIIEESSKRVQAAAKSYADQMGTPEAKAAMMEYSKNGQFSATGGQAVLHDGIGIPATVSRTKYADAFKVYADAIGEHISQLNAAGAPHFDLHNPNDVMQMLNFGMAKLNVKTMNQIKDDVLNDPIVRGKVSATIRDQITHDTLIGTLQKLSTTEEKQSKAVWTDVFNKVKTGDRSISDGQGRLDLGALAWHLEQASTQAGRKVDYGQAFVNALNSYAQANRDGNPTDPSYTIFDRAAEAALFGGNPYYSGMSDVINSVKGNIRVQRQKMDEAIRKDLSGQTTTARAANLAIPNLGGAEIQQVLPNMTPSATGAGSVEDIQRLFGGNPVQR